MSGVNTSRVDQPDQSVGTYSAFGRGTSPAGRLSGRVFGVWPGCVPRGALERARIRRLVGMRPPRGA